MKLSYTQTGESGPPLVIMHGLFGSARNWQGIAKQLANHYTVYALDLRNHGLSPHAATMGYQEMAGDVVKFLDNQELTDSVILGHSMGGKVAMELALSQPNRVNKLVVVDIAPVTYKHDFNDILEGLFSIPLDNVTSRKDADQYLARTIKTLSLRQFLLQNLVKTPDNGYQWRVNLNSIQKNMNNIMGFFKSSSSASFKKKTLFIRGGASSYLSPSHQASALDLFPNGRVETVNKAGHWPHVESPNVFLDLLTPFLAEIA